MGTGLGCPPLRAVLWGWGCAAGAVLSIAGRGWESLKRGLWVCGWGLGRRRWHLLLVPGFWSSRRTGYRAENKNREAWRGRASHTDHPHGVTAVLGSPDTKTPWVRAHSGVQEQGGPSLPLASMSKLKIK